MTFGARAVQPFPLLVSGRGRADHVERACKEHQAMKSARLMSDAGMP